MHTRSAKLQDLTWDDLRFLLAVQRAGSFAAAGQMLRVNQTTVARRIEALQASIGTRLVDRSASGCRMTDAGLRACAIVETMEAAATELESQVGRRDTNVEGTVRITSAEGFVPTLVRALAELRARYPRLAFELLTATHTLNLVQREADLAIRMTADSQPSLLSRRLGATPWALYASEGYSRRKGPADRLEGHDVIGFVDPLTRSPGGVWLAREAKGAHVVLRVNNVVSALSAAGEGFGLATAPAYMAHREPTLRRVRPGAVGKSEIYAVTHRELARVPRVRVTIDALAGYVKRHPEALGA